MKNSDKFQPPRCHLYPQCPCGWFGVVDCQHVKAATRVFYEMLPDFVSYMTTPATLRAAGVVLPTEGRSG